MPCENPTELEKERIQNFYLACRHLLDGGTIPAICVQRSFEEAMSGFMMEETWRPTHISQEALSEVVHGTHTNIQRAHGVVGDRLDRYDRTIEVLSGPEKKFDEWWEFYRKHDSTVLITKTEHAVDKRFSFEDLVPLPVETDLFKRGGFSFRFRKKHELKWAKSELEKLKCLGTTE